MVERAFAEDQRAGGESVSGFRRQSAQCLSARDGTILWKRRARGPQRSRFVDGGLHLRQRAACQALWHPELVRSTVSSRDTGSRTRYASRAFGQRRAAGGDVECCPYLAGNAGKVVPANVSRRQS